MGHRLREAHGERDAVIGAFTGAVVRDGDHGRARNGVLEGVGEVLPVLVADVGVVEAVPAHVAAQHSHRHGLLAVGGDGQVEQFVPAV